MLRVNGKRMLQHTMVVCALKNERWAEKTRMPYYRTLVAPVMQDDRRTRGM